MWPRSVKTSTETFKILVDGCGDLILQPPKASCICKFPCLLKLPPINLEGVYLFLFFFFFPEEDWPWANYCQSSSFCWGSLALSYPCPSSSTLYMGCLSQHGLPSGAVSTPEIRTSEPQATKAEGAQLTAPPLDGPRAYLLSLWYQYRLLECLIRSCSLVGWSSKPYFPCMTRAALEVGECLYFILNHSPYMPVIPSHLWAPIGEFFE